jgi:hypothetical protein
VIGGNSGALIHLTRRAAPEQNVLLRAHNEESSAEREHAESLEIDVAAVHDVERTRLRNDLIQYFDIGHFAVRNPDKRWYIAMQIEQGIETQLAGDLWNRQTLRNDKRAIYGALLVKIHEATKACQNLIHWREHLAQPLHWTPNADMGALEATITREFADYHAAQTELIRTAALMQVFGRKESGEQLIAYLKTNRRLELNSTVEPIKEQRNRLIGLSDRWWRPRR